MSSEIKAGDVVVCVDAKPRDYQKGWRPIPLKIGRLYRVRGLARRNFDGSGGIFLFGVKAAYEAEGFGFRLDRFRKIEPGKMEFTGLTAREKEAV